MKIKITRTIQFFFVLNLASFTCIAQWSTETWVNNPVCTSPDYQINPVAVPDGNGGAIIAWKDNRTTDNQNFAIFIQRIDANGNLQWANNGVPIGTTLDDNERPEIISDGNGGAILTWADNRNRTDKNIYAQRIDSNGIVQWTNNGLPICIASNEQIKPKVVSDGNGGAIIVWQDFRNTTDWDVYAQKINAAGVVQWAVNGIPISSVTNDQYSPSIVTDDNGGAIIAWRDERNRVGTPGVDARIWGQRINTNGIAQWTNNGISILLNFGPTIPLMVPDGNGGAIIAWEDWRNGQLNKTLYSQRIDSNGLKLWLSTGVLIDSFQTFASKKPEIISDGFGGAIITWFEERGTTDWDVYAQKINAAGIIQWTTNGFLVSGAVDRQDTPTLASNGNGGAIITWEDRRYGTTVIYAQNISSNGVAQWTTDGVLISSQSPYTFGPKVTSGNNGGAIITWTRRTGDNSIGDIYAQRVNSSGTLSIKEQTAGATTVKLFPNPAKDFVTIESSTVISDIVVFNELGQTVYNETSVNSEKRELNLSELPKGIYYYKLTSVDYTILNGKMMIVD